MVGFRFRILFPVIVCARLLLLHLFLIVLCLSWCATMVLACWCTGDGGDRWRLPGGPKLAE